MGLAVVAIYDSLRGRTGALLPKPLAREMVKPLDQRAALRTFIDDHARCNHAGSNLGFRCLYQLSQEPRNGRHTIARTAML